MNNMREKLTSGQFYRAVRIAMVPMLVVQLAAYQVIRMVAMLNRFIPTARPMPVVFRMFCTCISGCTACRIGLIDRNRMFFNCSR
jgi:hypothetical protein